MRTRRWHANAVVDFRSTTTLWSILVLLAPAAAFVRALLAGWEPEGDDATIVLRARETLFGQVPLQGMRSTAGGPDPALANHHLGPMELHLLLPGSIIGSGWAVALTCTVIAGTCAIASLRWAHRFGGDPAVVVFGAGLIVVEWSVGATGLFRPFNPYVGLIPIFLALVLLTAHLFKCSGVWWPLILTTGLIAQANLAYAPIGLGLLGCSLLISIGRFFQGRPLKQARHDLSWSARRLIRSVQRMQILRRGVPREFPRARAMITTATALVVWAPVLAEPLRHSPGNITQLAKAATTDSDSQGLLWALSRLGLAAPVPSGFRPLGPDLVYAPSALGQGVAVILVLALAVAALPWKIVNHRGVAMLPARAALIGLTLTVATFGTLPTQGLANHYLASILPVAVFAWCAIAWRGFLARPRLRRRFRERRTVQYAGFGAVAAVLLLFVAAPPDFTGPRLGGQASDLLLARTADLPRGSSVQISGTGFLANLSTTPAVALALERSGLRAHYLTPWPYTEDAERLSRSSTPADALEIHLVGNDAADRSAPPDTEFVGTIREGRDYQIDIYASK